MTVDQALKKLIPGLLTIYGGFLVSIIWVCSTWDPNGCVRRGFCGYYEKRRHKGNV